MAFLNPLLLLGTAGIGIPILIHLLNRRRFRKLPWAAMRYLKTSVERNQRRIKTQDWILLAIRCLLVVLLAIALARPSLKDFSVPWLGSEVSSVVILDRSASMAHLAPDGSSRFDKAKIVALDAVSSLPAGSQSSLMLLPNAVSAPSRLSPSDVIAWDNLLGEMEVTAGSADLSAAIPTALESLASLPGAQKELVIITDRQQNNWGTPPDALVKTLQNTSSDLKTHIVLIGEEGAGSQLAVSHLTSSQSLPIAGRPLRFDITISNHGTTDETDVPLRLDLDGESLEQSPLVSMIPAGETVIAQVYLTIEDAGYHQVNVTLPDDSQPMDNQRTAVLQVFESVTLTIVDGSLALASEESDSFFLRHALETTGAKVSVIDPGTLNPDSITDAAAVFLVNVSEFSNAGAIETYVKHGGGLVVFPGHQINPDFYNRELSAVLPAMLGDVWKDAKHLQGRGYAHPVVSPWSVPDFGNLAKPVFRQGYSLALPPPDDRASAIEVLAFEDGSPALVERSSELGRAFLFASTADKAWNDLPMRPDFVPLMSQILNRILHTGAATLHVEAGVPFERRVAPNLAGKRAVIFPLNSASQGWRTSVSGAEHDTVLRFSNTLASGAYEAAIDGQEPLLFAVQLAEGESSSKALSSAQVNLLRDAANVIEWRTNIDIKRALESPRSGMEFWKLLLCILVLLAVIESLLAQRFSRPR